MMFPHIELIFCLCETWSSSLQQLALKGSERTNVCCAQLGSTPFLQIFVRLRS